MTSIPAARMAEAALLSLANRITRHPAFCAASALVWKCEAKNQSSVRRKIRVLAGGDSMQAFARKNGVNSMD
jgi:hypothetical protein